MKIAILGAGFSGLATTWLLSRDHTHQITLFDPNGVGKGASGVAAGLLHGYVGAHSKRNWKADEGLKATMQLIVEAEKALKSPVAIHSGIFRPATHPKQLKNFRICADTYPEDVQWCEAFERHTFPGIFLKSGMVVDCPKYTQGLMLASKCSRVQFEQTAIKSLTELSQFDCIIVTMGASTTDIFELKNFPITSVKGQILNFSIPNKSLPLPYPINGQAYVLNSFEKDTYIVGATFEKEFASPLPDKEAAIRYLMPKIHEIFPQLTTEAIIDCRSGLRASTADHYPIIKQVTGNCFVLSGMGSKGLLYHALYAQELVQLIGEIAKKPGI